MNVGIPSGTGSNWETEIDGTPSLHFDGTSNALLAWDSPSLRVQSFTIATFVCPDTTLSGMLGQYPAIVDKHNWNTNTGYCLESLISKSDQMGIRCMSGPSVSTVQDLLYPELSCQAWTYIVATYNGSQLKLYQNGILKNTQNPPSVFTINYGAAGSDPLYIGNRGFQGKIRELKIFNRALTDTEIQNLGC